MEPCGLCSDGMPEILWNGSPVSRAEGAHRNLTRLGLCALCVLYGYAFRDHKEHREHKVYGITQLSEQKGEGIEPTSYFR